jgi:hypothetical protein
MAPSDSLFGRNDQDGLLPEPDAAETFRNLTRGSATEQPWRQRLLPAGLFSIGLHLFCLPLLMVITVTFADRVVSLSTWEASADQLGDNTVGEIDFDREPDPAQSEEESTVAVSSDEITVATGETKPADLLFSELSWDFGTIERGKVLHHEFRVKNKSTTAINGFRVKNISPMAINSIIVRVS